MTLTNRQKEVLQFVGKGWTDREIGRKLGISYKTVKRHLENVRFNLPPEEGHVRRTQLAAMWQEMRNA